MYTLRAFESNAVDYLLKPFRRERFVKALDWVRSQAGLRELGRYRERMGKVLEAHAGARLMVRTDWERGSPCGAARRVHDDVEPDGWGSTAGVRAVKK
jgi:YesN/AraC family two-component response regulator